MSEQVQAVVMAHNIFLEVPGEKEPFQFFKGETAEIERAHAEAILAGDKEAERDPRLVIVGDPIAAPRKRGRPRKVQADEDI